MTRIIRALGIVVPVRDEEVLLGGCLDALRAAVRVLRCAADPMATAAVDVVVVLDGCTDRSADVVAGYPRVRAVEIVAGGVGQARAAGFQAVLETADVPVSELWLATTDADSRVPADWLTHQVQLAQAGADVVLGTVDVLDWSEHPPHVEARWRASYHPYDGHSHVHGANAGFVADAYVAAGGFRDLDRDEDVALAAALAHRRVVKTPDIPVVTSARSAGRARGGFADHLLDLSCQASQGMGSTKLELT